LKEGLLLYGDRFAILDLTIYEVGNAVWRAYRRGAIKQPVLVARMFEEVLKGLEKLSVEPLLLEVLDIAAKSGVTFYDASYVYVAKRERLKLVTEDSDLLKFPEAISLEAMLKELKP
jgi:predicted nucleic acid-binding protein